MRGRSKPASSNRSHRRAYRGFSLIELLVAVVVLGIAIAGISEVIWVSAVWSRHLHNKFDNFLATKSFVSQFQAEVRHAKKITLARSNEIRMLGPTESQFNSDGFITGVTETYYRVEPDLNNLGYFVIRKAVGASAPTTVLTGVVGPRSVSGIDASIFRYIELSGNSEEVEIPVSDPVAVTISLEMKRQLFGTKSSDANATADLIVKSETYLRNAH